MGRKENNNINVGKLAFLHCPFPISLNRFTQSVYTTNQTPILIDIHCHMFGVVSAVFILAETDIETETQKLQWIEKWVLHLPALHFEIMLKIRVLTVPGSLQPFLFILLNS